jgi:hypothetical protein
MKDFRFQILIFCSGILLSCSVQLKTSTEAEKNPKEVVEEPSLFRWPGLVASPNTLTGWWVYGEGQHIFKDEETLEEYALVFPNENMEELVELYLSVCEMEYFPMECIMQGHLQNDTLEVADFEITYIQGCGE